MFTTTASKEYQSYLTSYHLSQMCSNNMSGTSSANPNIRPVKKNFWRQIFDSLIGCCTGFFTETPPPSPSLQNSERNSRPQSEGFVEINVGEQFAEQLYRKFGDSNQFAAELLEEDEEFAKKLQEEEKRHQSQGAAASSKVFLEEYRPSSYTLSRKNEITSSDLIDFDDIAGIDIPSTPQQYEYRIDIEEKKGKDIDGVDERDSKQTFPYPATFYRDQAQKYLKQREQFYNRANHCFKLKDKSLAKHYFMQAKELTRLYEQANNFAAAAFLIENKQKNPSKNTIDLHHLYVKEATQALDIFLDNEIYSLQNQVSDTKSLMVITGRGKHSPKGIPKIKPAVMERLVQRGLRYTEINPGRLEVHIYKDSHLTSDLTRDNVFSYGYI